MHLKTSLAKVHAISRPNIESQLREAIANRCHIAQVAITHSVDSRSDSTLRHGIKSMQPIHERLAPIVGLANQNLAWDRRQNAPPLAAL